MNRLKRIVSLGVGLALFAALLGATPAYGAGNGRVSMSRVWVHFQRGQHAAVRAALAQYGANFKHDFTRLAAVVITVTVAPPLTVAVGTNRSSYRNGNKATFTVLVTDPITGNRVKGAAVTLVITGANGQTITLHGMTNKNSKAGFKVKLLTANLGVGTYMAQATASRSGYSEGSGSTTFDVN